MEKAGIKIIGNVHVVAHGRDRSKADQGYGDHDTQEEGVFIERKTPDGKTILVPLTKESMKSYMASLREARQTTEEQTVYSANQSRNQNTIYANQQMLAA